MFAGWSEFEHISLKYQPIVMRHLNQLQTPRLTLIATTLAHIEAELATPDRLGILLDAHVSPTWPPGEYDRDALEFSQILHQYILTDYHRTQNMRKRAWKNIDENSEHHSPLRPTNTLHVTRSDAQSLPET